MQLSQWVTQHLKDYLIQGQVINEKRLAQQQQQIQTLKDGIRILNIAIETKIGDPDIGWLDQFAKGLELLDDSDHENLGQKDRNTHPATYPEFPSYQNLTEAMRSDFGDIDFYPPIEEKAATLFNHQEPFVCTRQ
ncbi:hypothetical protein DSL64_03495 [Dyadobacter luteus]|uniref:Uncharacterized protein n=1 Tax=Dyadobacter luteus TaxID=2259619 RepID=A0A3D8YFT4_9BACT|nr:hypothetical protein [Dyadobacter luteus]REA63521.1 hypothetical protein DSL64_03495 [Dyadobacter luteus]